MATSNKANVDGFIGGAQFGYNWQFDRNWLVGFEADFQGSAEKGSANSCSIAGCPAGSFYGSADHHLKWFGTVRGKLGWLPHERVVLYATGGLAYGHLESDYISGVIGGTLLTGSRSTTRAGWTVGGGVEGAIDRNWTVKLEYLYMDLGSYGTDLGTGQVNVVSPLFACPNEFPLPDHGDHEHGRTGQHQVHRSRPARGLQLPLLIAGATSFGERPAQAGLSFLAMQPPPINLPCAQCTGVKSAHRREKSLLPWPPK